MTGNKGWGRKAKKKIHKEEKKKKCTEGNVGKEG